MKVECRSAKEEAINRIEEKARALQSMHEQVTADLARVDQQNKRELQISDQLLASMQVLPLTFRSRAWPCAGMAGNHVAC